MAHSLLPRFISAAAERQDGSKQRFVKKQRAERYDQCVTQQPAHLTSVDATDMVVADIYPATRYLATVRAFNSAGLGPLSAELRVLSDSDLPEAPGEPFIVHTTKNNVVCGWLPPRYDNGRLTHSYELQRYIVGGSRSAKMRRMSLQRGMTSKKIHAAIEATPLSSHPEGETSEDPNDWTTLTAKDWVSFRFPALDRPMLNIPGLSPGDRCVVRIRATNAEDQGRFHSVLLISLGADSKFSEWSLISQPMTAQISIRVLQVASRSVVVEWDAYTLDAFEWELQQQEHRITGKQDPWLPVDKVPHAKTIAVPISGLTPGTRYRFRVRPRDVFGWRAWDTPLVTEVVRTSEDVPDAPSAPVGDDTKCTSTEAYVAWTAGQCNGQPITSFELAHLDMGDEDMDWDQATTTDISGIISYCTVQEVKVGQVLIFRVRAHNLNGCSLWSAVSEPVLACSRLPPGIPEVVRRGISFVELQWCFPLRRSNK